MFIDFIHDSRVETRYFLSFLKYALFDTTIKKRKSSVTWLLECVF